MTGCGYSAGGSGYEIVVEELYELAFYSCYQSGSDDLVGPPKFTVKSPGG